MRARTLIKRRKAGPLRIVTHTFAPTHLLSGFTISVHPTRHSAPARGKEEYLGISFLGSIRQSMMTEQVQKYSSALSVRWKVTCVSEPQADHLQNEG